MQSPHTPRIERGTGRRAGALLALLGLTAGLGIAPPRAADAQDVVRPAAAAPAPARPARRPTSRPAGRPTAAPAPARPAPAPRAAARPSPRGTTGASTGSTGGATGAAASPAAVRRLGPGGASAARDSAGGTAVGRGAPGAAKGMAALAPRPAATLPIRLEVSIGRRELYAILGTDTLLTTAAAVASRDTLVYGGRRWVFVTPQGRRTVLRKESEPRWRPPDWYYVEVARRHKLRLASLSRGPGVALSRGRRLVIRDSTAGVLMRGDPAFHPLPIDEHIVFDGVLYMPPLDTHNRIIEGELGRFRLDLGEGILIHGTPDERTVGTASTHGCIRLADTALEWVFANVPVGATVTIK